MAIELFIAGVRYWEAGLWRRLNDGSSSADSVFPHDMNAAKAVVLPARLIVITKNLKTIGFYRAFMATWTNGRDNVEGVVHHGPPPSMVAVLGTITTVPCLKPQQRDLAQMSRTSDGSSR